MSNVVQLLEFAAGTTPSKVNREKGIIFGVKVLGEEAIGVIRNVREAGHGLYADFHFNPKHALAEQIIWDAENAPENLGFSINAQGRLKPQGGRPRGGGRRDRRHRFGPPLQARERGHHGAVPLLRRG